MILYKHGRCDVINKFLEIFYEITAIKDQIENQVKGDERALLDLPDRDPDVPDLPLWLRVLPLIDHAVH